MKFATAVYRQPNLFGITAYAHIESQGIIRFRIWA